MLSIKQAFMAGFLLKCAEEGLTPDEIQARAARGLQKQADSDWSFIPKFMKDIPGMAGKGLGLGLLAATGVGAGAGYLGARMSEPQTDPEEVKTQELIAAYKHHAEMARREQARRLVRQPPKRSHFGA